jgi:hypothetical protein
VLLRARGMARKRLVLALFAPRHVGLVRSGRLYRGSCARRSRRFASARPEPRSPEAHRGPPPRSAEAQRPRPSPTHASRWTKPTEAMSGPEGLGSGAPPPFSYTRT